MSRRSEIDISIIVAHYNREDLVLETLESIRVQKFVNYECLVIDDCSNDSSPELIRDFCSKDKRFVYIRNDNNSGKCFSYNRGIKISKGKYIIFVDNDDIFHPDFIDTLHSSIVESGSDMSVCNYNVWYCDRDEVVESHIHPDSAGGGDRLIDDYIRREWYLMFPPQIWTKIFKKNIITDNNIEFIDVAREGNLFIHKYQFFCTKVSVVDRPLVNYRLFSDINKHVSGGDYYSRSDVLYRMIDFRNKYITYGPRRVAWNLYIAKFIYEVYTNRMQSADEGNNHIDHTSSRQEVVSLIMKSQIGSGISKLSREVWSNLVSIDSSWGVKVRYLSWGGGGCVGVVSRIIVSVDS